MASIKRVGIVGLGRMGSAIAYRLQKAGYSVFGYDPHVESSSIAIRESITITATLADLVQQTELVWLMVPANAVDSALEAIVPHMQKDAVIIDGGNSKFNDSINRANVCARAGISFLDCGTSGGLKGRDLGFCLMVGGQYSAYQYVESVLSAIAAPRGYMYIGQSGSGHYVKMVHNGIEYAILQAYAEGFHLLKDGSYKNLDLPAIAHLWNNGSVIRSWLLELLADGLTKTPDIESISGRVAESGMGAWTVEEAQLHNIPVDLIKRALNIRFESQQTGGNFATKLVALLRNQFGGHAFGK